VLRLLLLVDRLITAVLATCLLDADYGRTSVVATSARIQLASAAVSAESR